MATFGRRCHAAWGSLKGRILLRAIIETRVAPGFYITIPNTCARTPSGRCRIDAPRRPTATLQYSLAAREAKVFAGDTDVLLERFGAAYIWLAMEVLASTMRFPVLAPPVSTDARPPRIHPPICSLNARFQMPRFAPLPERPSPYRPYVGVEKHFEPRPK